MKFLVCYEDTSAGRAAARLAAEYAGVWNAKIEVVTAITRDMALSHDQLSKVENRMKNDIEDLFKGAGTFVECSLLTDNLESGEQIVVHAKRCKADLIFLGIKKSSRLGKMLFGSTVQHVILNAHCPVITLR
jgi:nucleotide-binding universal stress UspA family protein